jgi:hypothetical protein
MRHTPYAFTIMLHITRTASAMAFQFSVQSELEQRRGGLASDGAFSAAPSSLQIVIHATPQPGRPSSSQEHDGRDEPVEIHALKEGDCPDGGDGQIAPLLGHLQNFRQSGQQQ